MERYIMADGSLDLFRRREFRLFGTPGINVAVSNVAKDHPVYCWSTTSVDGNGQPKSIGYLATEYGVKPDYLIRVRFKPYQGAA